MSKFVINITSMSVGYLGSVAQVLCRAGHDVHCVVKSDDIGLLLCDSYGLEREKITTRDYKFSEIDHIKNFMHYEKKYREKFAMLCSYDRGLGKGYILNADKHPDQSKSYWSRDKKYSDIVAQIKFFDNYLTETKPDVVFGYGQSKLLALVCRSLGITYLVLLPPRWKNYYFFAENEYDESKLASSFLQKKYLELREKNFVEKEEENDLLFANYFISKVRFRAVDILKNFTKYVLNDTKRLILSHLRGTDGYGYLSWTPYYLARYQAYRFIEKVGVSTEEVDKSKFVLFPLQVEPESSLLYASPESNNSLELIVWISKNLSADTLLVVKEHPYSFGVRSVSYYKKLLKMPNIVLASHKNKSTEWIANAVCVATITGTIGFEAVFHLKPVLSFGRHQLINSLPTVRYVDSFNSTCKALEELLLISKDISLLSIAKKALKSTIEELYFQLDGFEESLQSREMFTHLAEISMRNLFKNYPEFSRV